MNGTIAAVLSIAHGMLLPHPDQWQSAKPEALPVSSFGAPGSSFLTHWRRHQPATHPFVESSD
jgi:hypothetical protein